jgi:hypothetical protein
MRILVLMGLLACLPNCTTIKITGSRGIDKTPDAMHQSETVHGSFWGFRWTEPEFARTTHGKDIVRVDYHHNALYLLASVATLGLYVPQGVEWWRDAPLTEEAGPSLQPNKNKD